MKYGESLFDIAYLAFALAAGVIIFVRGRTRTEKQMGLASFLLGLGDAFHLIPRVINYFTEEELTAALGAGKFVTGITMTLFYVLLYYIWRGVFGKKRSIPLEVTIWALAIVRVILCFFPQNGWLTNTGSTAWIVYRNIPFVLLGALILTLWFYERRKYKRFRFMWILILFSFLFYLPAAVGARYVKLLGMLMLPKTVCYILMILTFLLAVTKDGKEESRG